MFNSISVFIKISQILGLTLFSFFNKLFLFSNLLKNDTSSYLVFYFEIIKYKILPYLFFDVSILFSNSSKSLNSRPKNKKLFQQSQSFKDSIKTLELAVIYKDTYLNCFNIGSQYLGLLGISAYSIASKFNETEAVGQIKLQNNLGSDLYHERNTMSSKFRYCNPQNFSCIIQQSDYLVAIGVSIDESILSLIMFILMDFEICKHRRLFQHLLFSILIGLEQHFYGQGTICHLVDNNEISMAQNQFNLDKLEKDDTEGIQQNSGNIKKNIQKKRLNKVKLISMNCLS
ncbi:unnamed protein product [Paramecium octaurelia]|uniref:Cyclin N-terminal domain-containing protein n=1 Tax=Paramecium octaurelia TaxID=43137 RepID=A0A8S1XE76_PAROT|nr:unnamed protein product [Paramecium octaurelia]